MRRRAVLGAVAVAPLGGVGLSGCDVATIAAFPTLAAARATIEQLPPTARTVRGWDLAQVLHHAAQSIEFSLHGFPEPKPAWFQHTLGRAAFAVFDARGRMSHGHDEPIPGAPPLAAAQPLAGAQQRLLKALADFDAYRGTLAPHFAYGALDKPRYARAHLMHLADHWADVSA